MFQNECRSLEMDYIDQFGESLRIRPKINMYANNSNLYVGLECFDKEFGGWYPYCDVTVNIQKLPFLESAVDINNGSRIVKFLIDQGFGELTYQVQISGYCGYPVVRFNADKLKEIDPVMFAEYEKASKERGKKHKSLDSSIQEAKQKGAEREQGPGHRNFSSGRTARE